MNRKEQKKILRGYWIPGLLVLLVTSCHRSDAKNEIAFTESIRHDDFEYSVTDYLVTDSIDGERAVRAKEGSRFYIVTFQVANHAMKSKHEWDNSIAYIRDGNGNEYENRIPFQKGLDESEPFGWSGNYMTPAGTTQSIKLVFELPEDVRSPCLMVHGYILAGDILNGTRFRKKRIRLY